jgi:hypothetical protein
LIAGDVADLKVQIASIVALINLMMGAYPIMPRHGGKIMCTLLSATMAEASGSASDDKDENEGKMVLSNLGKHTAAVALVLCGPEHAGKVLEDIIMVAPDAYEYDPRLVQVVHEIRLLADKLLLAEETEFSTTKE